MRVVTLLLLLTGVLLAEEIPAAKIARITHQEGYTVKTAHWEAGEALVWLKGAAKPQLMLVFGKRAFTPARPSEGVVVGEGAGFKIFIDNNKKFVRVTDGGKTTEEKFTEEIDS